MKTTQVTVWGEIPKCIEVPAPAPPSPDSGLVQVRVLASGLHNLVRLRAAGKHYSANVLPHLPGVDGVGRTVPDGQLVYFKRIEPQGGSFAELIEVPRAEVFPLREGADPVQVAGMLNPVMASWMALARRSSPLPAPGWTCVIMGATSVSGKAAVVVARRFGAGTVIGVARNAARMADLGLDAVVELADDPAQTDFAPAAHDADVILDFIYGPPMLALFEALRPRKPVRYVQIGTSAGHDIALPGHLLRSKDITMRGTGPGAFDKDMIAQEIPGMLEAIASGTVKPHPFKEAKLEDIEAAWLATGERTVFVP